MKISTHYIDALLQQANIEGLIHAGAPTDEYGSEAEAISLALLGKAEDFNCRYRVSMISFDKLPEQAYIWTPVYLNKTKPGVKKCPKSLSATSWIPWL